MTRTPLPPTARWIVIALSSAVLLGGLLLGTYRLNSGPRPAALSHVAAGSPAHNRAARATPTPHVNFDWNVDELAWQLKDPDPAVQAEALAKIKQWCLIDPAGAATPLHNQWGKRLLETHRYAEAADFALTCILASPERTDQVCLLLRLRIRALTGQGQSLSALAAAKSLYNMTPLEHADEALYVVAGCLAEAYPDDTGIYDRFRNEQQTAGSPILASIHVDRAPYADALAVSFDDSDPQQIQSYGNLLLLSDQPAEARRTFALLVKLDPTRQAELTARLMKAQDGTLGRANAFIQQQVAAAPADKPLKAKPSRIPWALASGPIPAAPNSPHSVALATPHSDTPAPAAARRPAIQLATLPFGPAAPAPHRVAIPLAQLPFNSNPLALAKLPIEFQDPPKPAALAQASSPAPAPPQ